MTNMCIICANGNDLPDGECCAVCDREGTASGLRAAVIKARGRPTPPSSPVEFDCGSSIYNQVAAIYTGLGPEGRAWVDREWIKYRGDELRSQNVSAGKEIPDSGKTLQERHSNNGENPSDESRTLHPTMNERLKMAVDCLQSIADMKDDDPREPDDADWRFRALECKRCAGTTIDAIRADSNWSGGWEAVSTAPHETNVLLAHWDEILGGWHIEAGMASWGWRRNGISNVSHNSLATHWQPLPAPPLLNAATGAGSKP